LGIPEVGSLLSVPLLSGQQVLGALTLSSPSICAFRQQHLRLLELVADLGALALVQARQHDTASRQKEQLTLLLAVARGLGTTREVRGIIDLAVSAIQQLIRCEEGVVYHYETETETLCGVAGWGMQSPQLANVRIQVNDPKSLTAWVARQRRPLLQTGGST